MAIAAWDWGAYFGAASEKGLRLDIAEYRRPAPYTAPVQAKPAGLYMICTLSKHKPEARGYNDALLFDWRGQVAAGTGAKACFLKAGALHPSDPAHFPTASTRATANGLERQRGMAVG